MLADILGRFDQKDTINVLKYLLCCLGLLASSQLLAHGVAEGDAAFIQGNDGIQFIPFVYLGAKHMVSGYDHLLFLLGVIFFLYRLKDVGIYVSLFAIGHSVTLLWGVLNNTQVSPYIVDAIIGLSVVYKGFDNLGGFKQLLGYQPNTKAAVLIFGFFHGFGLATKLQDFTLSENGLVTNIVAFNIGVELGQLLALSAILIVMAYWRRTPAFQRYAFASNGVLMSLGFMLMGYQITGYIVS
ncbi:MAG: HupE/UreJ family protein [Gammaproteobacteria bacterium]|nr:HupE/UreJ family protein [Gammaproteobacteria bacterium]